MEEEISLEDTMGSPAELNGESGSLGSLGAFLSRYVLSYVNSLLVVAWLVFPCYCYDFCSVRQMDAKKLQQLATSSGMIQQQNGAVSGTAVEEEAVSAREKAFDVVYRSKEIKESSKEKTKMCFVVDSHERRIRCVSREEQRKQVCYWFILQQAKQFIMIIIIQLKLQLLNTSRCGLYCAITQFLFNSSAGTFDSIRRHFR